MDVELVVDKLEEFGLLRKNRKIGNYMSVYCPFHAGGQEKKPSCGILLTSEYRNGQSYPAGWTHCFACGAAYSLEQAVQEMLKTRSITTSARDWLVENVPGYEPDEIDRLIPQDMADALASKLAVNNILDQLNQTTTYVSEDELAKYRYTVPYMYERKLTDEIIAEYDVGYDANWIPEGRKKPVPCITFPVHDRYGRTLCIIRRAIATKLYHVPAGVQKPVYGLDRIPSNCKSVVICESIFNALTCRVFGYNAVALLGTGTTYQMQQLRELGVQEFVICMDGDEAGRRATNKLKKALSSCAIVWAMHMLEGKDVNDIDIDTFNKLYMERD
jgi:hypothetical protein